ncbi:MAG: precorrin-2 C(20)-methyltransferase [Polyangiaceae bacterium]
MLESSSKIGRLYGIGLGPGDPELVTVKASRLLGSVSWVFAPKADEALGSIAKGIALSHVAPTTKLVELVYPMSRDVAVLERHWGAAATTIGEVLRQGDDAAFITLGDPMLYSTCAYLVRALRRSMPEVDIEIVPGVTSFCASAALTGFVLGEKDSKLLVAPAPDSAVELERLTRQGGRLVLMKVGSRLPQLVNWLRALGLLERSRLVSRAGLAGQRIFSDLNDCEELEQLGYLSTLLVDLDGRER